MRGFHLHGQRKLKPHNTCTTPCTQNKNSKPTQKQNRKNKTHQTKTKTQKTQTQKTQKQKQKTQKKENEKKKRTQHDNCITTHTHPNIHFAAVLLKASQSQVKLFQSFRLNHQPCHLKSPPPPQAPD